MCQSPPPDSRRISSGVTMLTLSSSNLIHSSKLRRYTPLFSEFWYKRNWFDVQQYCTWWTALQMWPRGHAGSMISRVPWHHSYLNTTSNACHPTFTVSSTGCSSPQLHDVCQYKYQRRQIQKKLGIYLGCQVLAQRMQEIFGLIPMIKRNIHIRIQLC